jgi:hypothetical protein
MGATDFGAIERDLTAAFARRLERRKRSNGRMRMALLTLALAGAFCTAAIASGLAGDLQLDPAKWSFLGGGDVDGGRGAYVHAKALESGTSATFLVEHDDGLAPYQAFLLHEKTLAAAQASSPVPVRVEPGELCTAAAVTRAEQVALSALSSGFAPGTGADASRQAVDGATQAAFAGSPCRGLEYAGEQARLVYAGVQPRSKLMPGAR